jgi:hypothetical protein
VSELNWAQYIEQLLQECADREATANLRASRTPGAGLDGQMTIEALPTIYNGTKFRSLLEACWAATLDSLGVTWEYEPTTFDLPSGVKYLPDFHLPEIGTWIEVKGPGVPRVEKAYELGKTLGCDCPDFACGCTWPGGELVIVGHPPTPIDPWTHPDYERASNWVKANLARRHGGFVHWTSTRRHNSWMTRCSGCAHVTWIEGARLHRCPACGGVSDAQLYRDFEKHFEFVRLPWLSAKNTEDAA